MKRISASSGAAFKKWLSSHRISLAIIAVALCTSGVFIGYILYHDAQRTVAANEQREKDDKKFKTLITKLTAERKARETVAKKAAEEKARQKAAQQAAAATTTSGTVQASSASCNASVSRNDPTKIDVIVNKRNCLIPLSYIPADLFTSYGATLRREAANKFALLVQTAQKDGIHIGATSSYRSYAAQVATYQHWVAVNGSVAAADTVSARAGYSEHQTGLAVDVSSGGCSLDCFAGTAAYRWMKQNAHAYGFIERYPPGFTSITGYSPEAWHYRYVGVTIATAMKSAGTKTLEQHFGFPAAPSY